MRSIKPGRGPSALGAVVSAAAILFGIFWTLGAYAMTRNSPFPGVSTFFPLFGLLFIGIGIAQLIYNLKNTVSKNRFSLLDITEPHQESDSLERRFGQAGEPAAKSIESRLRTLEELKEKGLVSGQEYEAQRAKILQEI